MLILDENFRWHLEAFALNSSYIYRCISKKMNIMEKVFMFCKTFLYSRFIAHKLNYFKRFFLFVCFFFSF